jgi:hypothetical protein
MSFYRTFIFGKLYFFSAGKLAETQNHHELHQFAQNQLRQRILHEPRVQQIYDEKILHQSIENGKVNVTVFFSIRNVSY